MKRGSWRKKKEKKKTHRSWKSSGADIFLRGCFPRGEGGRETLKAGGRGAGWSRCGRETFRALQPRGGERVETVRNGGEDRGASRAERRTRGMSEDGGPRKRKFLLKVYQKIARDTRGGEWREGGGGVRGSTSGGSEGKEGNRFLLFQFFKMDASFHFFSFFAFENVKCPSQLLNRLSPHGPNMDFVRRHLMTNLFFFDSLHLLQK